MRPRGEHYNALALDLGTSTGWAILCDDVIEATGQEYFPMDRDMGRKAAGNRLRNFLEFIKTFHYVDEIFYEHNHRIQAGEKAVRVYYGMLGILEMVTAAADVNLIAIHTTTLKKGFTGNGRAQKEEIGRKCVELGWKNAVYRGNEVANHDEADAIALLFHVMWSRERHISF